MEGQKPVPLIKSPISILLIVMVSTFILTQLLAYQQYLIVKDDLEQKELAEANSVGDRLKTALSHSLSATRTLAFIVEKYGGRENFDTIASEVLSSVKFIDALELTDKGVITHVYPLKGNELALGYDVLRDPSRNSEALRAIKKKELFFAGPLELRQGGMGIVGRLPMFTENQFVGFSAVIIKLSTLLEAAGIDTLSTEFNYQLSKLDPKSGEEKFFLPDQVNTTDGEINYVTVPDGQWKLYASSKRESQIYFNAAVFSTLGILLSVISGLFAWQLAKQPEKLKRKVDEQVALLTAVEKNYETTLERVSDAFIAYDRKWNYTYINSRASEILELDRQKFIGKNIWKEFPELTVQPIYEAYIQAMTDQSYLHIESYFPKRKKWFENHIYPSPDGLSVFFRDITESKKKKDQLEASEKYFRALIEKSSDAIVLLDGEGKVLYQSPSTNYISGYTFSEIEKSGMLEAIHPEDQAKHQKMFLQLVAQPRASISHLHRFRHKAGHYIWIEGVYTNLLHDENVKAIVYNYHDCTKRVEAEQKVIVANRLYQVISKVNQTIVRVTDEKSLFQEICDIAVNTGEFSMAWVAMIDKNSKKALPVTQVGDKHGYVKEKWKSIELTDSALSNGPTGLAIVHGEYVVCNDIANDPRMKPWKDLALASGYKSSISLPIKKFGETIGAFSLYASVSNFFDAEQITLLEETTSDISFTLENIEKEKMRRLAEETVLSVYKEKETVLNRINDAVVSVDNDWRYTFFNDAALMTHPLGRSGTLGKTLLEVHPEMETSPFWKMYQEAKKTKKVMETENYFPPMNTWFSAKVYPSDDGLTIFYKDITELKKAEQQIKEEKTLSDSIINSLPGIFYLYDRSGKFIRWNKNFETISGYSPDEIGKMHPVDFYDTDEKELLQTKIEGVFINGDDEVVAHLYTKERKKIPYYFNGHKICLNSTEYLIGVGIDISDRVKAEKELMAYTREIQKLTAHLEQVREEERTRIAREIHDELGQQITGLKMDATWLLKRISVEEKAQYEKLSGMIALMDNTVKVIRRISTDLRPGILDDLGLAAALEWQSSEFEKRTEIHCSFKSEVDDIQFVRNVATGIFRIYQETLTNVLRHSKATRVEAHIKQSKTHITLSVKDNGQGFDPVEAKAGKTLGLIGMRERALVMGGELLLESKKGKGTTVILKIPLALVTPMISS